MIFYFLLLINHYIEPTLIKSGHSLLEPPLTGGGKQGKHPVRRAYVVASQGNLLAKYRLISRQQVLLQGILEPERSDRLVGAAHFQDVWEAGKHSGGWTHHYTWIYR